MHFLFSLCRAKFKLQFFIKVFAIRFSTDNCAFLLFYRFICTIEKYAPQQFRKICRVCRARYFTRSQGVCSADRIKLWVGRASRGLWGGGVISIDVLTFVLQIPTQRWRSSFTSSSGFAFGYPRCVGHTTTKTTRVWVSNTVGIQT